MQIIWEGLQQAFYLLIQGDAEIRQITALSLYVSGMATLLSLLIGFPLGTWLALGNLPGKKVWLSLVNTGMALPPVVVGLAVSLLLWRSGPLGELQLMYTPTAIIIAQTLISLPVITGLTASALQQLDSRLSLQMKGLGATPWQIIMIQWWQARLPLAAAVMAGFGSVISEVGASMMVGGNIRYQTRVLTTAIVLENSRGAFAMAIALSFLLLFLAYLVNLLLTLLQQKQKHHRN